MCAEVRYAIDEENLICWFITSLNKPCQKVENKEKIVGITNDDKKISEMNNKDLPIAYHNKILQQDTKLLGMFDKTDIDEISHEVKIVEHKIEITSKLEKVKMDEVEIQVIDFWIG
ncbi:22703_t:CDS:2 [Gigaspora margarita]|uniref:22703_t:CDS:1 n=1 Tax=Gigaspora margarita TaxID=4874 RepID=A0ABM8W398_GIGMA|nr:22703_t:CDS:2 [Gigaspora margarita]